MNKPGPFVSFFLVLTLVGCTDAELTPTTLAPTPTEASTATIAATDTAPAIQEASLTPSATATLTPLPATVGEVMMQAQQLYAEGDFAAAVDLLQSAESMADKDEWAVMQLLMGRILLDDDQPVAAVEVLEAIQVRQLSDDDALLRLGLLGMAYQGAGDTAASAASYDDYLDQGGAGSAEIQKLLIEVYQQAGEYEQAVAVLESMDLSLFDTSDRADLLEQMASLYLELDEYDAALAAYEEILSFAQYASYRSLVMFYKAQTLLLAEDETGAVTAFGQVLTDYPYSYGAYLSLVSLDELEQPVEDNLIRGRALLAGGQSVDAANVLLEALNVSTGSWDEIYYYLALAYEAVGDDTSADICYAQIIDGYPNSGYIVSAWFGRAELADSLGQSAAQIYQDFASTYPNSASAPEALWLAAEELQDAGEWYDAALVYQTLRLTYPTDSGAPEALFQQGLCLYVDGQYELARDVWAGLLDAQTSAEDRVRTLTWLGKVYQQLGDAELAQLYWAHAVAEAPQDYYGLRAADLLNGASMFLDVIASEALVDTTVNETDWDELESWLVSWAGAEQVEETAVDVDPLADADALWSLGLHDAAVDEYVSYRQSISDDPYALLAFLEHVYDLDVYQMSIWTATRLQALAELQGVEVPQTIQLLAYPIYYGELISATAAEWDVDPLLFMALVRQESRFDAQAISWAGAIGLTQVMPTTGEWIATKLGDSTYSSELLTRPIYAVPYGIYYIAFTLDLFDYHWPAALAAYNAGPGNVGNWDDAWGLDDLDLFYEMVPLDETQLYMNLIYANYRIYQQLYD